MTGNQLRYWELKETARTNRANEATRAKEAETNAYKARIQNKDVESQIKRRNVQNMSETFNTAVGGINTANNIIKGAFL